MVSASFSLNVSEAKRITNGWIMGPWWDLFLVCGGLLWAMLAVQFGLNQLVRLPAVAQQPWHGAAFGLATLPLLLGTYLVSHAHASATLYRVYQNTESRKKYWFFAYVVPVLIVALAALVVYNVRFLPVLQRVSGLWNIQHWVAQSFGIALIYFHRADFPLDKTMKGMLKWACNLLIILPILQIFTFANLGRGSVLTMQVPFIKLVPDTTYYICEQLIVGFWGVAMGLLVIKSARLGRWLPLSAVVLLATTAVIALRFTAANLDLYTYGLPFFHGIQYMVISALFFARERGLLSGSGEVSPRRLLALPQVRTYLVLMVVGGLAMYGGSTKLLVDCRLHPAAAATLVALLINIQHFLIDAGLWRMKDKHVRDNVLPH